MLSSRSSLKSSLSASTPSSSTASTRSVDLPNPWTYETELAQISTWLNFDHSLLQTPLAFKRLQWLLHFHRICTTTNTALRRMVNTTPIRRSLHRNTNPSRNPSRSHCSHLLLKCTLPVLLCHREDSSQRHSHRSRSTFRQRRASKHTMLCQSQAHTRAHSPAQGSNRKV